MNNSIPVYSPNKLRLEILTSNKYYLILFIIWPFLAFIIALINYSNKEARKVVYIFLIYYGLTFALGGTNSDSFRYIMKFEMNATLPFSNLFVILGGLYSSKALDFAEPLVSFIVSRFSSYYGVYYAVWAAIYGFFYLKSINLLYKRYQGNPGWNSFILMAFFTMIMPIMFVSSIRMWTASWIFFYGAYHVIIHRERKYLLLAILASFFHWSFFSVSALLIIYSFAGNRNFIYFPILLVSIIYPNILNPVLQFVSFGLGGGFQSRFEGYTNENYVAASQSNFEDYVWFMRIGVDLIFYFLLFSIAVIYLVNKKSKTDPEEKNLMSFLLLFLSFRNFGINIPSFGSRFTLVFILFATLYVFLYMVKLKSQSINWLTWIGLFPMALMAAINFRLGSNSINAWLFAPGVGLPLLVQDIPLSEILF